MSTHTQPKNFLSDGYATVHMPVVKNEKNAWMPKYFLELIDSIGHDFFKCHYVQRYYTKGRLYYLYDKLARRDPQKFRFWVEVTIRRTFETEPFIQNLLQNEDVTLIDTPEKYQFPGFEAKKEV